ncbi:MAG: hypothetical protein KF858_05170 [Candidatus Sumerlaeia bacterium]|nr:hypothetical protein [Candidatus Sumerlaeia bacterium]
MKCLGRLAVWCVLACAVVAGAQPPPEGIRRGERHDLIPGIRRVEISQLAQDGAWRAAMLAVDRTAGRVAVQAVLPGGDGVSAGQMEALMAGTEHQGGFVVAVGDAPTSGVVLVDGTLRSWPGAGPHLVARAEGTWRLIDIGDLQGVVWSDTGTSVPLLGINQAPAGAGAWLVSGPLDGDAAAAWPASAVAMAVAPGGDNAQPGPSVWDRSLTAAQRAWRPRAPRPVGDLRLGRGEWALILSGDLDERVRLELATARDLRFEASLPADVALGVWTVPAGRWVVDALGQEHAPDSEPARGALRAYVALDDGGDRLWLVESGGGSRGEHPFATGEMVSILRREGARTIAELPAGARRLLAEPLERARIGRQTVAPARVALLAGPGRPELRATGNTAWRPLPVALTDGSNVLDERTGPHRLVDGKAGDDPAAETFWAAPLDGAGRTAGRAWAELRLEQPARVHAVDLVHIEASGFSPHFNLKGYRLLGRESASQPWRLLAEVRHETPVARERVRVSWPRPIETIRLEVQEPNFAGGATARLAEMIVWGEDPGDGSSRRR